MKPIPVTIAELNIFLQDALRGTSSEQMLGVVEIQPCGDYPSGWTANICEPIPEQDRSRILGAISELQKRYALEVQW